MPTPDEKEKRKAILRELAEKQREAFEQSLPMARNMFLQLFDYLDARLEACDNTLTLTKAFLEQQQVINTDEVLTWLEAHGGYCDCEVPANIEEQFN